MFVSDSICQAFRKCCEAVGIASTILVPVFFALSFVLLAVLGSGISESVITISVAVVFTGAMIVITGMLFAESRRYKKRRTSLVASMPLRDLAQPAPQPDHPPHANGERCDGMKPRCRLCRTGSRRVRLGCLTPGAYCEDRNE
ncbi:hypothetical protein P9239_22365 [Caballeronia sp. LZ062]|uniref:hypothetical protein n=1 Tax=unclassified Caballeronia TaxID=2646786 RepID=UPI002865CFD2|nr:MULTISPECIES: hypothetical protein [unclassified Caballeronia]MDR5856429.1 hypothetical protein [Caballeronia sp. LZ050]MDR5873099.1 hypothetical protein [Caballeronia sp. LZ062]